MYVFHISYTLIVSMLISGTYMLLYW